jgi:hypothetical protein
VTADPSHGPLCLNEQYAVIEQGINNVLAAIDALSFQLGCSVCKFHAPRTNLCAQQLSFLKNSSNKRIAQFRLKLLSNNYWYINMSTVYFKLKAFLY